MSQIVLTADTLSTATAGAFEYDGKVPYVTPQGAQRGVILGAQFYRLDTNYVGLNATGAQGIFGIGTGGAGIGVTLSSSTVYAFESIMTFTKTAGATSHTMSLGFGGTATVNNILYQNARAGAASSSFPITDATPGSYTINTAASTANSGAIASAAYGTVWNIKGNVSINVGGTFVPQLTLSAAPGGAYTTVTGSYFLIYPISTSGAATNVGTWS